MDKKCKGCINRDKVIVGISEAFKRLEVEVVRLRDKYKTLQMEYLDLIKAGYFNQLKFKDLPDKLITKLKGEYEVVEIEVVDKEKEWQEFIDIMNKSGIRDEDNKGKK